MNHQRHLLLPTDLSDTANNAYRFSLTLCRDLDARLQLLHVVYPEYAPMDLPVMSAEYTQNKVALAQTALKAFVDLGKARVQLEEEEEATTEISINVEVGNPAATISRIAQRDAADWILMGTRGHHNLLEKTFGSVTTEVLMRTEVPVMVIPEEAYYTGIRRVAIASEVHPGEADQLLKVIDQLSPLQPEYRLVHIHSDKNELEAEEKGLQEIQQLFDKNGLAAPAVLKLSQDSVIEALEDYCEDYQIDLLVMLSRHRTLWERIFYRSKTRQMIFQTKVPLFIYPA